MGKALRKRVQRNPPFTIFVRCNFDHFKVTCGYIELILNSTRNVNVDGTCNWALRERQPIIWPFFPENCMKEKYQRRIKWETELCPETQIVKAICHKFVEMQKDKWISKSIFFFQQ